MTALTPTTSKHPHVRRALTGAHPMDVWCGKEQSTRFLLPHQPSVLNHNLVLTILNRHLVVHMWEVGEQEPRRIERPRIKTGWHPQVKLLLPAPALGVVCVHHLQVHATGCQTTEYNNCGREANPNLTQTEYVKGEHLLARNLLSPQLQRK